MTKTTANEVTYRGGEAEAVFPIPFPFADNDEIQAETLDADGEATPLLAGDDYVINRVSDGHGELVLLGEDLAEDLSLVIRLAETSDLSDETDGEEVEAEEDAEEEPEDEESEDEGSGDEEEEEENGEEEDAGEEGDIDGADSEEDDFDDENSEEEESEDEESGEDGPESEEEDDEEDFGDEPEFWDEDEELDDELFADDDTADDEVGARLSRIIETFLDRLAEVVQRQRGKIANLRRVAEEMLECLLDLGAGLAELKGAAGDFIPDIEADGEDDAVPGLEDRLSRLEAAVAGLDPEAMLRHRLDVETGIAQLRRAVESMGILKPLLNSWHNALRRLNLLRGTWED